MTPIEIIPAIMPKHREDIEMAVARYLDSSIKTIQIDIMDGGFTPAKTWPFNSKQQYQELQLLQKEGFPGWQDIDIELDLMIEDPLSFAEQALEWGPARIIIHASSVSPDQFLKFLDQHTSAQTFIHFGIAFHVDDDIDLYRELFPRIDFVQCMGIGNIGAQGQVFDNRVIEQIHTLQKLAPEVPVSVDGGVNPETSSLLIKAGAMRLVSGSYMAQAIDIEESITKLSGENIQEEI